ASWEQAAAKLTASQADDRDGEVQRARTLLAKIDREYESLTQRLTKVNESLPADITKVLRKLGLPDLSTEDFTRELLGRRTLNHLERLSYWVDLSRRRLGVGLGNAPLTYPSHAG